MSMTPADLASVLRPHLHAGVGNERELQEQIAHALVALNIPFERERALSRKHRPDFLVGGIAVEVKVAGSVVALLEQVIGYLEHESVTGALVVSTKTQHRCPPLIHGKPVVVVHVTMLGVL